jgi:hypothetical protein
VRYRRHSVSRGPVGNLQLQVHVTDQGNRYIPCDAKVPTLYYFFLLIVIKVLYLRILI